MSNKESQKQSLAVVAMAALGVVFGDIGTSPLYALRECFNPVHGVALTEANILGMLALVLWCLILVVSIKYVSYIMRADNQGEGGELALMSLITSQRSVHGRRNKKLIVTLALIGASLLYGDGVITPAISVLSAVEGLGIVTHQFEKFIVPITLIVLVSLFTAQKYGTARIGGVFGPIMMVWFVVLSILGIRGILMYPGVWRAINPLYAVEFLKHEGMLSFMVLGSVFLAVTGCEALFTDMGHFGRKAIHLVWFALALPGLVLNYLGQGAMLLSNPQAVTNPFYSLAPEGFLIPLVVLSTMATIIASQAVISGTFSLTRQAVQLGFLPTLRILHTSSDTKGQIYVPLVNTLLLCLTAALVIGFGDSSKLASAYGIAVAGTMVTSTLLMFFVTRLVWGWSWFLVLPITGLLLTMDLAFLGANMLKVSSGGWVPLVMGISLFTCMLTWRDGRRLMAERLRSKLLSTDRFVERLISNPVVRVPGTAVVMSASENGVPPALIQHVERNKVLHQQVVVMTITAADKPYVINGERLKIHEAGQGLHRVVASYGFMESPDVPEVLELCAQRGLDIQKKDVTFFVGKETIIGAPGPGMAPWRDQLFAFLSRNVAAPTKFFKVPPDQVIEIGLQVEL